MHRIERKSVYETGSKTKFIRGQTRCDWDVCMVIGSCLMETFKKMSEAVTSETIGIP